MPKPPVPDDLQWCIKCRKVLGNHKGWFGAQCQGHDGPKLNALEGAHSIGVRL